MTSAEATASQSEGGYYSKHLSSSPGREARGISRAGIFSGVMGRSIPIHVSDFSMLMGPSVNQFSTAAPSASEPFSGFSMRHDLIVEYALTDRITIGPSFGVNETLYQSSRGSLVFNDPSMRLAIADINRARFGDADLRGSLWLQAYAPVSVISRLMHEYTGISVAYIPSLRFGASRFSLSGVGSVKTDFMENQAKTGMIVPIRWVAAVQGNYRISRPVTFFMMDHVNTSCGPRIALSTLDFAPNKYRIQAKMAQMQSSLVTDGIMTGARFRVTRSVGISPRLDWQVNQPLNTTTVGLNASFQLI